MSNRVPTRPALGERDRPAVGVDDVLDDDEADARPPGRGGVPAVEDGVPIHLADPGAAVGDVEAAVGRADAAVSERAAEEVL
jgi:hypothetical protein